MGRENKKETVFEGHPQWRGCPEEASEFIAWFQEKLNSIPTEFRDSATIKIDCEGGYEGSYSANVTIAYWRPETDEEMEYRTNWWAEQEARATAREKSLLKKLKKKYPDV